ncbi:MAG: ROK family protein [bacterium]|nr:ROK family protein [bacterium]
MALAVGVEIGGTKLQAGAGPVDGRLLSLARAAVDPSRGARGIREKLPALIDEAIAGSGRPRGEFCGVGVGFGGPVDSNRGVTLISHQIEGWNDFPLAGWLHEQTGFSVRVQNDASIAGLAEALEGAGKGFRRVFYITIGSGIGGGWVVDGRLDEGGGLGAAEIGHTWVPDPDDGDPEKLENLCSGWSIGRRAREALDDGEPSLLERLSGGDMNRIDARMVYQAAERDDLLARAIIDETCNLLGVAIGNIITLLHPERVVVGGGVSLMGPLFWDSLRASVSRYAFHLFEGRYEIVPAALGEDVVVVGAAILGARENET